MTMMRKMLSKMEDEVKNISKTWKTIFSDSGMIGVWVERGKPCSLGDDPFQVVLLSSLLTTLTLLHPVIMLFMTYYKPTNNQDPNEQSVPYPLFKKAFDMKHTNPHSTYTMQSNQLN